MRRPQIFFFCNLFLATIRTAEADDFHRCLETINSMTIDGKTDNHGRPLPPSTPNATAITYALCVSQCGAGQQPFKWKIFSQQFSSWLLPWIALTSQLPWGANDKLENLESMLITVGSPTLAAYSLALTVLNDRWIARRFARYRYANVRSAVRILSSLQQSPLRVDTDDALLASLVLLPQNDKWWTELVANLDFTHTWSVSTATSIGWVITAFILTIVDYFSEGVHSPGNSNGQGVGSTGLLWLWLLNVVVGWLQISPKCDSIQLNLAMEKANSMAYVATSSYPPIKANAVSKKQAISIEPCDVDEARLDEYSTPPVFNYARFLPWVEAVMVVSHTFHNVSERDHHHDPIFPEAAWHDRNSDDGSRLTALHVENYCLQRPGSVPRRRWGLDSSVVSRMLIASAAALILQWGTTGGATIIVYFTPTIGLGCRSASFLTYGMFSTLVWMMLLSSSILTYYSTNAPAPSFKGHFILPLRPQIARWLAILLRRLGKLLGAINAVWVVSMGLLQFGGFYNRCYCNSSAFGLGKGAYNVIIPTQSDLVNTRAAWIAGFSLAAGAAGIFAGFVTLLIHPPLPP